MRNVVKLCLTLCLAANNILLMHKQNHAFIIVAIALA